MNICDLEQCTGCSACLNICSHGAISMVKGVNGHLFPEIDTDKCVGCNQCVNSCPNNTLPEFHTPVSSYVATAVDRKEALTSTSAGIASVFSRHIIENGGVVYGSSGIDCQHVRHIRVASSADIDNIKGSKYVQSAIEDAFTQIKADLIKGINVLFIGTPCQVSGLYGYLRKKYDNLYTVDLVCHGVPSQQILNDALKAYIPDTIHDEVILRFRKKEKGKSLYGLFAEDKQGRPIYHSVYPENEYITGFLSGLFYRESCYQCHYARPERVSDITVGDYWDREKKVVLSNSNGGLSMVIVNTEGGQHLMDECNSMMNIVSGDFSDFVKRNGQLDHPINKYRLYDEFVKDYQEHGFLWAAKKSTKDEKKRVKKAILKTKIKEIVFSPLGKHIIRFFGILDDKAITTNIV